MRLLASHLLSRSLPVVLGALVLVPTADAGDDVVLIQFLSSTGADADGTARARWRDKGDSLDFSVELEHLGSGTYDLFVADVQRGSISVDGTGFGEIEFKTPLDDPKPLFDFDVLGESIEVRQDATTFFSDVFAPGEGGGGGGGGGSSKTKTEVYMVNVGPDANAKGRLRYETKSNELRFSVNVEHLDAGVYDLVVGGSTVATFDTTGLPEVELQFRDPPDDSPSDEAGEIKLALDFDPLGRQVDVVSGETTYLTGVQPGASSKGSPSKPKQVSKDVGKKKGDALLVKLLDLGVLSGAKGTMKLAAKSDESEFEVEIEHVVDGSYSLCVGDVERGVIVVTAGEGRLDFSTSPEAGQLSLDFAVKGELVQVKLDGDAILANVFPTSVQGALGKFKKESSKATRVVRNLTNAGTDLDARGVVKWTLAKNGRERLKLVAQDLFAGEYPVLVDDVLRGTLVVSKDDGNAKLLFDSKGGGKSVLLDFDVLGSVVRVVDGSEATVLEATVE
ncbi:MAG: hypothetical protein H6825_13085 [Planctomycetes bacterium]|nr:hypothetical protein [Planctomycetota bacterium]